MQFWVWCGGTSENLCEINDDDHIHLPVCLWIMDPHSRASKKNTSHGNEVLPQDTTHLLQRPCHQQGSPCHEPAGNRTTRRPSDHRKKTQAAVVWTCLPFIRSGESHLARHRERGEEDKADRGKGGKTTSGNGQAWSSPSPRGQRRTEKKWRKLVVKSSVVPQRPSRLRDRWGVRWGEINSKWAYIQIPPWKPTQQSCIPSLINP